MKTLILLKRIELKNKDELLEIVKDIRNNERKIAGIEQEAGAEADDILNGGSKLPMARGKFKSQKELINAQT
jgi:RNA polymerase primary sigma factor